jgi:hypothetical protein
VTPVDPRLILRLSYDADLDFLWALVPGEVVDGQLDDEITVMAEREDEDGDLVEFAWWCHRGPGGPLVGFGIAGAFAWSLRDEPDDAPIWDQPRVDVPTLGLRDASVGEIVASAQRGIRGSTPDVLYFDAAVAAKSVDGDLERAEVLWRACLECGEMKAHFGLGYTLCDLGRPREALGHLMAYTEICPRNAWAWVWRGRAAEAMGERAEAIASYRRALECEAAGSYETDAEEFLAALGAGGDG